MRNKTETQVDIVKRYAEYASRRIAANIDMDGYSIETIKDLRGKFGAVVYELLIHNAECHEFIHDVLTSGAYQDYEYDAQRILSKTLNI